MHFRRALRLLPVVLLVSCSPKDKNAASSPPARFRPVNLVVVTIDTLRPDHLGCYGYSRGDTPALDRFAQGGAVFENAVAQTPLTPPSHASLFTGQNPNVHQVRNTGGFILHSSARPLARLLQEQGWDTAAFVGAAVLKKAFGFNNGFAVYDDQMPKPAQGREYHEDPERRAAEVVDRATQWLATQSGKPYFLWVHVYDPHLPYNPPAPFDRKYKERPYDGEIAYTDQQLARLFDAIAKKSANNTIVAVLSDHGESLTEHGEFTHGVFLYDSTLRIAFMMRGPGVPAGVRVKQQARSIDFLPTVLELLGGRAEPSVQGVSLVPALTGKEVRTDISYQETLYPKIAMGWAELRAIRTNRWKYVRAPKSELYDLNKDPGETTNVIQQNPAEVQKFEAQLQHLISPKGNGAPEKVDTNMVDERIMDQLKSLGYLSGFSPRNYELTGKGIDPKDRVEVLRLIEFAEDPHSNTTLARRIDAFEQALKTDPTNPSLYHQLGGKLEKAGRQEDALKLYRTALERGIENGRLHSRIADLSLRKGDKDTAILEYEKAAQFNPSDVESQTNLATAYLEKGRIADAERVFKWIVTTDPQNAGGNNGLGLVAIQRRDPATARTYFERAVSSDPDLVEAQMNLGIIYEMSGDRARARACFEAFLAKASQAQYGHIIPKVRQELASLQ